MEERAHANGRPSGQQACAREHCNAREHEEQCGAQTAGRRRETMMHGLDKANKRKLVCRCDNRQRCLWASASLPGISRGRPFRRGQGRIRVQDVAFLLLAVDSRLACWLLFVVGLDQDGAHQGHRGERAERQQSSVDNVTRCPWRQAPLSRKA